ncbi:phage tail tape measure protein [Oceanobacillus sp. FSL H7-0719]|uniref:phage tail tape measure protein n=1 Tax=Oceanobacillus sp. FSL H7-0719 TaxID=2954507 RepID=UPI0032482207
MSKRIKGITIELDGDTKGLDKALKDVNKESRDIQKELRDVDRLLKFNPKNTELVAQKQKLLGDQVQATKKKLEQLKGSQEQVTEAFKKGQISEEQYRNFQREIAETESKLNHYENQLKNVDKTQRSFGDKLADSGKKVKDFGEKMTTVGKELSLKVTAPLMAVGGVAAKIGMDFKAGLSEVQALSGATGDELARLEERSRELGASTKFSAKEVTDGFKYMALAGWDVQQSLDGIDGVLNLAAASGEDLGRVSDILTDSISAFGDEAKDAGRYADVLAAASSNANTDVAGLGESFKMVAPVAGALGYSLEDTAVALGLMANAGVKGSSAGTALRSALTNLVKPTAKMEKEMKKLGINIKDSNGEMKPLDVLLGDLRERFSKLSEDQKASSAATIFGKEAMAGMLAVINAGEGDFNKLTKAIANSEGVAEEMADTMQNNLQGKLINLKSALEELAIKLFDALEPALTAIVGATQKLVDWLNGLSKEAQLIVVAIGAFAAAIGPLLLVLGPLLTMLGGLMTVLPTIAPVLLGMAGPVGIVVGALTALGVAFALTRTKADESYQAQEELAQNNLELAETQLESAQAVTEQIDETTKLIDKTKEQMETTEELVDTFEDLIEKSKLSTDEFGEFLTLQTELENTKSPQRIAEIEERMEGLRKKSGMSKEEFNRLLESNEALAEQFPEAGQVIDDYGNVIMDTTGKLRDLTNAELERMQTEVYNQMIEDLRAVNSEIDGYNNLLGETLELEDGINETKSEINNIQNEIKTNQESIKSNDEEILALKEQQKDASFSEWWQLNEQIHSLQSQNIELDSKNEKNKKNLDSLEGALTTDEQSLEVKKKTRDEISNQIDKNMQNYDMYVEILGKQFDINIEKGKENKSIDDAIKKRKDEIKQLEDKIKKEGDSNGKSQEKIEKLNTENSKLEEVKGKLKDINGSLDTQSTKYTTAENNLEKVYAKAGQVGDETKNNVKLSEEYNKVTGKKIDKDVNVKTNKDADEENKKWSSPIKKVVNVVADGLSKLKFWAKGTNYHPGGKAVLGEEGTELVEHGGKLSLASFGMYDLPTGAKVFTHEDTVNMLRNGLVSGIGKGIGLQKSRESTVASGYDNGEIVGVLREQNGLLLALLKKNTNLVLNDRVLAEEIEPTVTEIQQRNESVLRKFRG